MKLSTRGRYGMRALLELGIHYGEGPLSIRDIAKNQAIPQQYLEQIVMLLSAAGLVKSHRGARGGIKLARQPAQLKLDEIIKVLEGPFIPVECVVDPSYCKRYAGCVTRDLWQEIKTAVDGVLEGKTLKDLVDNNRKKQKSLQESAPI